METIVSQLSSVDFALATGIIPTAVFVVTLGAILGIFIGRRRGADVLSGILFSLAVLLTIPEAFFGDFALLRALLFLVGVIVFFFVASSYFGVYTGRAPLALWKAVVLGVGEIGSIFSATVLFLPREAAQKYISSDAYDFFTAEWTLFFFLASSLLFFIFARKR